MTEEKEVDPFVFKWRREARLLRERAASLRTLALGDGPARICEARARAIEEVLDELSAEREARGKAEGKCNRTDCGQPGARWWNTSTRAYYCQPCAFAINDHSPGLCVLPGLYWYSLPGWERREPCVIEERGGELYVRFSNKLIPERMGNVPASARFEPI